MRTWRLRLLSGMAVVVLAGCTLVPSTYHLAPDGAKEFVLTMRAGAFSPNYLVVNRGNHVRLVIHSYYQFAFFTFNQFHISRLIAHDTPEIVEFVATERGWFDFTGYGQYPYYASTHLILADISDAGVGGTASPEHVLYGRLYVL